MDYISPESRAEWEKKKGEDSWTDQHWIENGFQFCEKKKQYPLLQ